MIVFHLHLLISRVIFDFHVIFMLASESSLKNVELTDIESLGTKVAVRYGVQLKLLQSTTDGVEDLTYLLKYCKFFLQGQQRTTESTLRILVLTVPHLQSMSILSILSVPCPLLLCSCLSAPKGNQITAT